jgi:hypothetical protein
MTGARASAELGSPELGDSPEFGELLERAPFP